MHTLGYALGSKKQKELILFTQKEMSHEKI